MFRAGHQQVPALRRALSCWWRQIGDAVCRCAYESGLQVKGKLIPAENRGIISHWSANLLTRDEAQRIAANIAKLPGAPYSLSLDCVVAWLRDRRKLLRRYRFLTMAARLASSSLIAFFISSRLCFGSNRASAI